MAVNVKESPKEVCSVIHRTKRNGAPNVEVSAFRSELTRASIENNEYPLQIYSKFSRFVVTIISGGKSVSGNLNVNDATVMIRKSEIAFTREQNLVIDKLLGASSARPAQGGSSPDASSPAYTVVITMGTYKGKTPAEVLSADAVRGPAALEKQADFLRQNVGKYPANQKQIDAISDAISLFRAGKLNTEVASSAAPATIPPYSLCDIRMRPLIRKKRASDGYCPAYEIIADWHFGAKYPVSLEIATYFAPVETRDDGTLNVILSRKTDEIRLRMNLGADEWYGIISSLDMDMKLFAMLNASPCFREADQYAKANRDAATGN